MNEKSNVFLSKYHYFSDIYTNILQTEEISDTNNELISYPNRLTLQNKRPGTYECGESNSDGTSAARQNSEMACDSDSM